MAEIGTLTPNNTVGAMLHGEDEKNSVASHVEGIPRAKKCAFEPPVKQTVRCEPVRCKKRSTLK